MPDRSAGSCWEPVSALDGADGPARREVIQTDDSAGVGAITRMQRSHATAGDRVCQSVICW